MDRSVRAQNPVPRRGGAPSRERSAQLGTCASNDVVEPARQRIVCGERNAAHRPDLLGGDVSLVRVVRVRRVLRIGVRALALAVDDVERRAAGFERKRRRIPSCRNRADQMRRDTRDVQHPDRVRRGVRNEQPLAVRRECKRARRCSVELSVKRCRVRSGDAHAARNVDDADRVVVGLRDEQPHSVGGKQEMVGMLADHNRCPHPPRCDVNRADAGLRPICDVQRLPVGRERDAVGVPSNRDALADGAARKIDQYRGIRKFPAYPERLSVGRARDRGSPKRLRQLDRPVDRSARGIDVNERVNGCRAHPETTAGRIREWIAGRALERERPLERERVRVEDPHAGARLPVLDDDQMRAVGRERGALRKRPGLHHSVRRRRDRPLGRKHGARRARTRKRNHRPREKGRRKHRAWHCRTSIPRRASRYRPDGKA